MKMYLEIHTELKLLIIERLMIWIDLLSLLSIQDTLPEYSMHASGHESVKSVLAH